MKFKCKICGQQIDNPYICPFCGSGSNHIILIDEESVNKEDYEEKVEEEFKEESDYQKVVEKLNDNIEVESENDESLKINTEQKNITEVDNVTTIKEKIAEKVDFLEEKPAEINYFLKIYGYLYLHDIELANKFKVYLDHYILEKSISAAENFNEEDFKNFTSGNEFLNKILKQFKL